MKRRRSYAFSHREAHFCSGGGLGEEGRFDVASRNETPKTSCQNHKQQLLRPPSGPSEAAHTRTTQPGERTASTEQISKKRIKLILKAIGNRKGDCA